MTHRPPRSIRGGRCVTAYCRDREPAKVFVVCGNNRRHGGIHGHGGCPMRLLPDAVAVIESLCATCWP
ncbi:DUF6196 family protein [Embleya sp. NPDC050154]|uniref:DUF6196 family protein n=1 Tax=Embleya sp. NPDC050154 TaxID=3363988 RepID=UPI00379702D2